MLKTCLKIYTFTTHESFGLLVKEQSPEVSGFRDQTHTGIQDTGLT